MPELVATALVLTAAPCGSYNAAFLLIVFVLLLIILLLIIIGRLVSGRSRRHPDG